MSEVFREASLLNPIDRSGPKCREVGPRFLAGRSPVTRNSSDSQSTLERPSRPSAHRKRTRSISPRVPEYPWRVR